jgi:trans-L-3-hydroxyproline dehydratase
MLIFPHETNGAHFDSVAALRISTIDTHTAGEPLRIILDGTPLPNGANMLERWHSAQGEWNRFRRLLMLEPRGHADMYGALIVPPVSPDALFGVLFMHNEGYSTGCGHGTIALAKVAVDLGWTPAVEPLTLIGIDAPSGLLKAYARVADGHVTSSGFENVPSFASLINQSTLVPGIGNVHFDLGYGGAFYAFVDADVIRLQMTATNARQIVEAGMAIKRAVVAKFPFEHPQAPELSFLYGTIFTSKATKANVHSRHVCVFADGALDRSPTGTGVAGRLAILRAKGQLDVGQALAFESITGECFTGRILRDVNYPNLVAVVTEIEGTAYITGRHEFILEKRDPFTEGFLVR